MIVYFEQYWDSLKRNTSWEVFGWALVFLCIGLAVSLFFFGFRKGLRYSIWLLLVEYVSLLYSVTVFFRKVSSMRGYNFTPLWSYFAYFRGDDNQLLPENVTNIMVFVPVGFLLGMSSRSITWPRAILIGACLSVGIESLQFIFLRGFSEFDDVMHNTLGCVMGYGLFSLLSRLTTKRYGYTENRQRTAQ